MGRPGCRVSIAGGDDSGGGFRMRVLKVEGLGLRIVEGPSLRVQHSGAKG